MKVRTAIGRTALRARLTAVSCGGLILLGIVTLSACSGGGPTTPLESSFTIIGSLTSAASGSASSSSAGGGTSPGSATTTVTVTPTTTTTTTVTPTPTTTTTVTPTPSPSPSPIPSYAPVTGGGGTAGFQDGLLLAIGAAAIAAGAGGIAYHRRLTRRR